MKKHFLIISALLALLMFTLMACKKEGSGLSGDNIDVNATTTTKSITLKYTLPANDNIKKGIAKLSVKYYLVTDDDDDSNDDYKGYKDMDFLSKSVYTSYELSFNNLDANTKYRFELFLTFDGDTDVIRNDTFKTSSNNTEDTSVVIKNADDFLNSIQQEGYYTLENDIDFDGETVTLPFNSTNKFKGTFDGNGKTIKNFKLESNTDVGLFRATDGATIKNLTIENASIDASRSGFDGGILIGEATKTVVENVTINDSSIKIECDTASTTYRIGGLVGYANGGLFNNNKVNDLALEFTKSSLKVSCGLFIGEIDGEALKKQGEADVSIIDSSFAKGTITSQLNYETSTQGFNYIGGFIGNIGTPSRISNSYTDNEILVSKYTNSTTAAYYNLNLAVGGFAGTNANGTGTLDVENCLAITSIALHAGKLEEGEEIDDFTSVKMTKNYTYVAGFLGYVYMPINKVSESYVYFKETTINNMYIDSLYNKASSYSASETYYILNGDTYEEVDGVTTNNFSNYYVGAVNTLDFDSNKTYYTLEDDTFTKQEITEFASDVTYYVLEHASVFNSSKNYYKTTDDGQTYVLDDTVTENTFSNYYVYGSKKIYVVDFANPEGNAKFVDCETSEQGSSYSKLAEDILDYLTDNYLNS